jgi:hypothetical protein
MFFYFNKKSKLVSSYSEGKNTSQEEQIEITPTAEELSKLRSNLYDTFIRGGRLEFVLNDRGKKQDKTDEMKVTISKIQSGTNTKKELANLLLKIIT